MKASYTFIAIDCLSARIGKKLPVDIVGVVTNVSALSSIKRSSDGTELVHRAAGGPPSGSRGGAPVERDTLVHGPLPARDRGHPLRSKALSLKTLRHFDPGDCW